MNSEIEKYNKEKNTIFQRAKKDLIALLIILFVALFLESSLNNLIIIFGFIGVLYYVIRSTLIFVNSFQLEKEKMKQQQGGVFKILGVSYAIVSVYFIVIFILNIPNISQLVVDCFPKELSSQEFFRKIIKFVTSFVCIAFSWNLSKAFYTLNALEEDSFAEKKLKFKSKDDDVDNDSFAKSQRLFLIFETSLRLIIVITFIFIENTLSQIDESRDIYIVGVSFTILYILLLFYIMKFKLNLDLDNILYKQYQIQYFSGLALGILLMSIRIGTFSFLDLISFGSIGIYIGCLLYIVPSYLIMRSIIKVEKFVLSLDT